MDWKKFIGAILGPLALIVLWFAPLGMDIKAQHALAITLFMIIFWITEVVDHSITGLIGLFLYWTLGVADISLAFSGFANDTTWFIFGAMIFGMMATKSGLAKRITYAIMSRAGSSYSRLLLALILVNFIMTFLVPSSVARLTILASMAIGLVSAFDLPPKSNVGRGLFVMITYLATILDKMIIAGVPSIMARGIIEKVGKVDVFWSHWFIAFLPCDLITLLFCWRITLWLYPPEKRDLPGGTSFIQEELKKMGSWNAMEWRALFLMLIAIGLWMTDFIHHIKPSTIAIGVGLAACLPKVGFLDTEDVKKVNFLILIFAGAVISMGEVLVKTGAINFLADIMLSWLASMVTSVFGSAIILYWTAFVYHLVVPSEIVMVVTALPFITQFALDRGLDPLAMGMIWVFAVGGKIFVFQSGPLILGYSYGYFEGKDVIKVGALLTVVESIILLTLVPIYWPLIGIK